MRWKASPVNFAEIKSALNSSRFSWAGALSRIKLSLMPSMPRLYRMKSSYSLRPRKTKPRKNQSSPWLVQLVQLKTTQEWWTLGKNCTKLLWWRMYLATMWSNFCLKRDPRSRLTNFTSACYNSATSWPMTPLAAGFCKRLSFFCPYHSNSKSSKSFNTVSCSKWCYVRRAIT